MVEYGWIRFQAKWQQQLELVVASRVIRKGGGVRSGQKIMDLMCCAGGFQRSRGNFRILKKRRWSFFLWPWLQSPLRSRSALWDKCHCDVSVLCYVVWWDWWAQVWQIKTAANKRRQMDSEFMVDGECMWMLQRFLDFYCPNLWIASNYWPFCLFCFTLLNPTAVNQFLVFIIIPQQKNAEKSVLFFVLVQLLCQKSQGARCTLVWRRGICWIKDPPSSTFQTKLRLLVVVFFCFGGGKIVTEGLGMSWMITWVNLVRWVVLYETCVNVMKSMILVRKCSSEWLLTKNIKRLGSGANVVKVLPHQNYQYIHRTSREVLF